MYDYRPANESIILYILFCILTFNLIKEKPCEVRKSSQQQYKVSIYLIYLPWQMKNIKCLELRCKVTCPRSQLVSGRLGFEN